MTVFDLTALQTNPPADPGHFSMKNGKVVVRDPKTVTGIMLHQTAVWYSVSAAQVSAAGGDRHEALHRRALNVACHLIAFDGCKAGLGPNGCGHGVEPNPLEWYVYQANTANSVSLGIEIEGAYPGTVTPGCVMPSARVIQAARESVAYAVEHARRLGMPLVHIWAHRQSSSMRQADPGQALWQAVVLDYAVPTLGLQTQPKRTWGDGRPIPLAWDPNGVGPY